MSITFWLRALCITFVHFVLLLAIGIFSERFEVSPLPAWTFTVFLYLLLFLTTFLCARWLYGKLLPTKKTLIATLFLFLVVQSVGEGLVYRWLTHASLRLVLDQFTIVSLILLAWHAVAIVCAYYQKRRQVLRAVVPEGIRL